MLGLFNRVENFLFQAIAGSFHLANVAQLNAVFIQLI